MTFNIGPYNWNCFVGQLYQRSEKICMCWDSFTVVASQAQHSFYFFGTGSFLYFVTFQAMDIGPYQVSNDSNSVVNLFSFRSVDLILPNMIPKRLICYMVFLLKISSNRRHYNNRTRPRVDTCIPALSDISNFSLAYWVCLSGRV